MKERQGLLLYSKKKNIRIWEILRVSTRFHPESPEILHDKYFVVSHDYVWHFDQHQARIVLEPKR